MGFIKWLYSQYRAYKNESYLKQLEPTKEQKDNLFMQNFQKCNELGFTPAQLLALMNLLTDSEKKN